MKHWRREPKATWRKMFSARHLRRPLMIAIMMVLGQRLTGIGAIFAYSTKIFGIAGLEKEASQIATVLIGLVNIVMTFASLLLMEKYGRKTLMLVGLGGMLLGTTALFSSLTTMDSVPEMSWMAMVSVFIVLASFAIGPSTIAWFYVGEIFDQSYRPMATSAAGIINWGTSFTVVLLFPLLEHWVRQYVFLIFMIIQFGLCLFIYKFAPETKGKTVDDILTNFKNRVSFSI